MYPDFVTIENNPMGYNQVRDSDEKFEKAMIGNIKTEPHLYYPYVFVEKGGKEAVVPLSDPTGYVKPKSFNLYYKLLFLGVIEENKKHSIRVESEENFIKVFFSDKLLLEFPHKSIITLKVLETKGYGIVTGSIVNSEGNLEEFSYFLRNGLEPVKIGFMTTDFSPETNTIAIRNLEGLERFYEIEGKPLNEKETRYSNFARRRLIFKY